MLESLGATNAGVLVEPLCWSPCGATNAGVLVGATNAGVLVGATNAGVLVEPLMLESLWSH